LPFSYTHHLPAATVRQHGEFLDVKFLFDKVSVALKSLIVSSEIYISNPSAWFDPSILSITLKTGALRAGFAHHRLLRTGKSLFIAF
jgi:hypothetical protein